MYSTVSSPTDGFKGRDKVEAGFGSRRAYTYLPVWEPRREITLETEAEARIRHIGWLCGCGMASLIFASAHFRISKRHTSYIRMNHNTYYTENCMHLLGSLDSNGGACPKGRRLGSSSVHQSHYCLAPACQLPLFSFLRAWGEKDDGSSRSLFCRKATATSPSFIHAAETRGVCKCTRQSLPRVELLSDGRRLPTRSIWPFRRAHGCDANQQTEHRTALTVSRPSYVTPVDTMCSHGCPVWFGPAVKDVDLSGAGGHLTIYHVYAIKAICNYVIKA